MEGELRHDADASPAQEEERAQPQAAAPPVAEPVPPPAAQPVPAELSDPEPSGETAIAGPTAEEMEQSRFAYQQTADRLDTAIRAADPGADHPPPMDFNQMVQSLYLTAIMQMGGGTPEGEQPRIDILGARQSIDMVSVVSEKTKGNLTPDETRLLDSALFELRMMFLEMTQALARSAAARGAGAPKPGIVR
jgi:hypothetical protein